jgi:voltage-gated potassium channel
MYVVEGPQNGYTSIPISIYWAISTMTTVGFGDIVPKTNIGRMIASIMMLLGWGILAVPTGIVTAEITHRRLADTVSVRVCPACGSGNNSADAKYCQDCGAKLEGS